MTSIRSNRRRGRAGLATSCGLIFLLHVAASLVALSSSCGFLIVIAAEMTAPISAIQDRRLARPTCTDGTCRTSCGDCCADPNSSDCTAYQASCGPCSDGSFCGDGTCDTGEDCSSCPVDCGACPSSCGDGTCDPGEDCSSCPVDCGACPSSCGDGTCDPGEDCASCEADCGACNCGDGQCTAPAEDCASCPADCGACPAAQCGFCASDGTTSCSVANEAQICTSSVTKDFCTKNTDRECPNGNECDEKGDNCRARTISDTCSVDLAPCPTPMPTTSAPSSAPSTSPSSAPVECTGDSDCGGSCTICIGGACQFSCDQTPETPFCNEASSTCVCTSSDQCVDDSPCLPKHCHGDGYCYTADACAPDMTCVVTGDTFQCNPITDAPSQSPSMEPVPELNYVYDNDCTTVPGYTIETGCPGSPPLDLCEGDCDGDSQCAKGLICRQRTSGSVAGCAGTPTSDKDYCIFPDPNELVYVYDNTATDNVNTPPLQECQGDCDTDNDCDAGLVCHQRTGTTAVYGCTGSGISGKDYCHVPPPPTEPPTKAPTSVCLEIGEDCSQSAESDCCSGNCVDGLTCGASPYPELTLVSNGGTNYQECQGDCDTDEDCAGSLVCFQSDVIGEVVPGCSGVTDGSTDYCFTPTVHSGNLALFYLGDGLGAYSECQGDCDSDGQCPAGMRCFQRGSSNANARIPNCDGTGIPGEDYCYQPEETPPPAPTTHVPTATPTACPQVPEVTSQPTGPVTYKPGEKTAVSDDGHVQLSTGLIAKVIAMAGSPVNLAGGGQSAESFHSRPDGAAVFEDGCGGWSYVSNSEAGSSTSYTGGVGALYFNALGEVTGYRMIQKNTRRNCSGGKTWWGTWVTCEECGSTGGVFEVHHKGHSNGDATIKRNTLLGRRNGRSGGNYEGVAYYNPSPTDPTVRPSFYLTEDATSGPLERFRPSNAVLADAIANNDFYKLLHDDPDGTAVTDYLNLVSWETDDNHLTHYGSFNWSPEYSVGSSNANQYFQQCEGIDVRNGMLYMTCKANKQFFILDLEARTYVESHTDNRGVDSAGNDVTTTGPFTGQPDQIRAFLNDTDDSLVYFCEDVGDKAGIHAKNSTGQFYTIAQDEGGFHSGETTGLAFSPDHKHMYVAWQTKGYIYDITRADGRSFGGETLAIQYHGMNPGANEFIHRFLRKRKD